MQVEILDVPEKMLENNWIIKRKNLDVWSVKYVLQESRLVPLFYEKFITLFANLLQTNIKLLCLLFSITLELLLHESLCLLVQSEKNCTSLSILMLWCKCRVRMWGKIYKSKGKSSFLLSPTSFEGSTLSPIDRHW